MTPEKRMVAVNVVTVSTVIEVDLDSPFPMAGP
jgi:hypothetical protein